MSYQFSLIPHAVIADFIYLLFYIIAQCQLNPMNPVRTEDMMTIYILAAYYGT